MRAGSRYRTRDCARRDPRADWEALALDLAAAAWRCRVELGLLGALVVTQVLLGQWVGGVVAGAVVLAVVGGLLAVRPARHRITRLLRHARVRRTGTAPSSTPRPLPGRSVARACSRSPR